MQVMVKGSLCMKTEAITPALINLFGDAVEVTPPDGWVVRDGESQLLVLLSEDQSWLRVLVAIAPAKDAEPYLQELLAANFDDTQETRYALSDNVLWGVFQHGLEGLTEADLKAAIARLLHLHQVGLNDSFNKMAERQVRQIIWASKKQGQSLEATLQTLERFYAEGMLGGLEQPQDERAAFLDAWHYQIKRLWDQVDV